MIGLLNIRDDLRNGLSQYLDMGTLDEIPQGEFPEIDGIFVDWVTKDFEDDFVKQAVLVEHYVKKGVPTVIFDRHLALTRKEHTWLGKFNTTFLEPAICNRAEFEYFPQWVSPLERNWYQENDRKIDLGYSGILEDRTASFEKYYKVYAQIFPEKKVLIFSQLDRLRAKIEDYRNHNLEFTEKLDYSYFDMGFTILIGSFSEYNMGFLRLDLFDIMRQGVIPLCPIEHRHFGSMFQSLVVKDERDVDYYVSFGDKVREIIIEEVFENTMKYYPEFDIKYAVDKIRHYFTM